MNTLDSFSFSLYFYNMEIYRPLGGGLFIYECVRLFFLLGVFAVSDPGGGAAAFPWLACVVPNALFPLMTLFLWLDISNYAGYWPLYISGKCISLVSVIAWLVLSWQGAYIAAYMGIRSAFVVMGIMLFGDMLSLAAGFLIVRKLRIITGPVDDAGGAGADDAAAVKNGGE
jgi:hypothetical protein